MALNPGSIIEGYEIVETIGTGAMSTVYLGKKDNNSYAIKELKSEFSYPEEEKILKNAFRREADLLFNIFHPGIPSFYMRFTHDKKFYIVMEYIKGISLEEIIKGSTKPFEEQKALSFGIQICEILFYLHTLTPEPIIYRDLKPSNIIITEGNIVRLIDFGVARRYDPHKDCDTVRLGTPGYAAPEQCRTKGQTIPQSDIYALGVVLHQILTLYDPSVTPFKLPSVRKLNTAVSEQLEWIINKAINLDLRDRYIDTGLFRDELVDYYEEHFQAFTSPYRENLPYMKGENYSVTGFSLQLVAQTSFLQQTIQEINTGFQEVINFFRAIITLFRLANIGTKIAIGWIFLSIGYLLYYWLFGGSYYLAEYVLTALLLSLPLLYFIFFYICR
jgi:serine/threonine protein kinase